MAPINHSARLFAGVLLAAACLSNIPAAAQIPELAVDLTPESEVSAFTSSSPRSFQLLSDGKVVFIADAGSTHSFPAYPATLWVTGGTRETTLSLPAGGRIAGATESLVFGVEEGLPEDPSYAFLWRTDGTQAGTFPVADLEVPRFGETASVGDWFFFVAQQDLYATQGDAATTRSLGSELGFVFPQWLLPASHRLLFVAEPEFGSPLPRNRGLWEVDAGSGDGRLVYGDTSVDFFLGPRISGNKCFFGDEQGTLWVYDIDGGSVSPVPLPPDAFVSSLRPSAPGEIALLASQPGGSLELWRSDGTTSGTRQVTSFGGSVDFPFTDAALPWVEPLGGELVFVAGNSLWRSGADPGSTVLLTADCSELFCEVGDEELFPVGGLLAFKFRPPQEDSSIWLTDGTPQGTLPLSDLCATACDESAAIPHKGRDVLLFSGLDSSGVRQLWVTDGTMAGTRKLTSERTSLSIDREQPGTVLETSFGWVVSGIDQEYGTEPWVVDPDGGGASILADLAYGRQSSEIHQVSPGQDRALLLVRGDVLGLEPDAGPPAQLAEISSFGTGRGLFFGQGRDYAWDRDSEGAVLMALGESPAESVAVGIFGTGPYPTIPRLVPCLGEDYFLASGSGGGLWKVNGAGDGAIEIVSSESLGREDLLDLRCAGNRLVFVASSFEAGTDLFSSDGTHAGTSRAFQLGAFSSSRARLSSAVDFGGSAYFTICAADGIFLGRLAAAGSLQLIFSPGDDTSFAECADDTREIAPPVEYGGELYFLSGGRNGGMTLRRTDGTAQGTEIVFPNSFFFSPSRNPDLASTPNGVVFAPLDLDIGTELWVASGGEPELLLDIRPGLESSSPRDFRRVGDLVYFVANDDVHGAELWRTDGTAAGTRLVHDLYPGVFGSEPEQLTSVGDRLYFVADDGLTGRELWFLPLDGREPCRPEAESLCLNGRYKVEGRWEDFQDRQGHAQARALTEDTGLFWFFDQDNLETMVKVLDGRANNDHVWTFYGALSNVEYRLTVTDTETGLTRRYFNPKRNFASVGDTRSFGPLGASLQWTPEALEATAGLAPEPILFQADPQLLGACTEGENRLCLQGGRFAVEVTWADFRGNEGDGTTVPLTDDTGAFWFFRNTNVELLVKVLDGRPNNGHFWVFLGSLSNVDFDVTVTDTETGEGRLYQNRGRQFASFGDTQAF